MSQSHEHLFESALSLPQGDRADLAFQLLQSLDQPGEAVSGQDFAREIHERVDAHRRGELASFTLAETRDLLQQRLSPDREP